VGPVVTKKLHGSVGPVLSKNPIESSRCYMRGAGAPGPIDGPFAVGNVKPGGEDESRQILT